MKRKNQYPGNHTFLSVLFFGVLIACSFTSFAQFNLKLTVRSIPGSHQSDSIYVAGNFNDWKPADEKYKLSRSGDHLVISIPGLKENEYEFKFTRGDWSKVEVTKSGTSINNRIVKLISDSSMEFSIEAWADDLAQKNIQHSASANVHVLDSAFFMPQLSRTRKIWIYLPPGYANSKKKYPVLYMHDGQNIFDDYTAYNGEWGVDECLDSLINNGKTASIVVGIENGPERINEYNPYDNDEYGKADGEAYLSFLVGTLKPYVDKHYRTLVSRENTFIAGSSVGALISYYAMLRYPDVFGKAGIFSPAFWIAPQIDQLTDSVAPKINGQFFFYAGEAESETMLSRMSAVADKLGENSSALIYQVVDPAGKHNEQAWRKWFGEFYLWITGNGLSYQVKTGY